MQLTDILSKSKMIILGNVVVILALISSVMILDVPFLLLGLFLGGLLTVLSLKYKEYIPAFLMIYFSILPLFYSVTSLKQLPLSIAIIGFLGSITIVQTIIQDRKINFKGIILVFLFGGAVIVSSLYNGVSLWEYKSYLVPLLTAVYLIMFLRGEKKLASLEILVRSIVLFGIVNAIIACFQFYGYEIVAPETDKILKMDNQIRSYGLLGHPTKMGQYFALSFGVAVGYFSWAKERRKRRKRILPIIILATIFVGLITTLSRGAIAGTFIATTGAVMILKLKGNIKLLRYLFIILVLFIITHIVFPINMLSDYITRADSSTQMRKSLNQIAIEIFKEHPLTGVGIGQYTEMSTSYGLGAEFEPHNTYLGVLSEYGILGFVAFLTILFYCIRGFKNVLLDDIKKVERNWVYLGFFISFIAILIDGVFHSFEYSYMLWILIAIGLSIEKD